MTIVHYKPNEDDKSIVQDITEILTESLDEWYGAGSRLDSNTPQVCSYKNSFILRYLITIPHAQKKTILVKIRRNPKIDSLHKAIAADIHQNIPTEYQSLKFVFSRLAGMEENFDAIRPLVYVEKYHAIVMEEIPSRTLRQLLVKNRSATNDQFLNELKDAARKTGKWLYHFHHQIHTPTEKPYSTSDILHELRSYADRLELNSHGRVRSNSLVEAFSKKLEKIHIDSMTFSESHADMTCDNVLYSSDNRVCIIDIKTRQAPIYSDLGLILIHPETSKSMIFSMSTYFPESLLRVYRSEIIAGYFDEEPVDEKLVRIYSAIKVMDKWLMYEELMSKYKGIKHLLSVPVGPFVTAYFKNLFSKHLEFIEYDESRHSVKNPDRLA